ncbi:RNA polymerase subunit sigma [Bacillus sp. M6-12]|uniref:sigma-70 family RNA polymerase sigma factor n=1 Tax=Bacillus sp. M6-12 TaxID=2054166 RepID=UPI000C75AA9C|nr:sigma-70 family RNA polymerase sigma factor [Bacillus sp. M6-12]PLS17678.1 RNA polymerase subunit sigma [Bacillus sp. M6-12]
MLNSALKESEITKEFLMNQLMNEYGSDLKRIAFLYVNDIDECEDIIQEVFLTCYLNLSSFRQEASYKTWLIRVTINKCKDYRKRWSIKNLIYKPVINLIKTDRSAEDRFFHKETGKEIAEKISGLSGKYKEVLILYYYQDMNMNEISKILNISINTVKSRLLRGKKLLQNKLERGHTVG